MEEQRVRELCAEIPEKCAGIEKSSMNFFSCSQYGKWTECEARQLAIMRGEWKEKTTDALIFGKYFHAYFESSEAFEKVKAEHREDIFTQKGQLRAEFAKAESMFQKVESDTLAKRFVDGLHEVEIIGMIGDFPWRGKIDVLNVEQGFFVDLKAVADIYAGEWKAFSEDGIIRNRKVSFIEAYNYYRQMAVYQHLLHQKFGRTFVPLMLAVSKQEYPDIELISFTDNDGRLDTEIGNIITRQPRFAKIKTGEDVPGFCGHCDFCRSRKRIKDLITPKQLATMVM